jgi:hypothetical protein
MVGAFNCDDIDDNDDDTEACGKMSASLIQGVSRITLQRYSKCYSVANVTKTFTLKDVHTI